MDLNRVGIAFAAPPQADDLCVGPNSPVARFDGSDEAGVQKFISAAVNPLPSP